LLWRGGREDSGKSGDGMVERKKKAASITKKNREERKKLKHAARTAKTANFWK